MLDIVIVNWNSGDQLEKCLSSIEKFSDARLDNVIVVDNASADSSMEKADLFAKVKIILSKDNLGFGKACNLGAKNLKGKYILFLNPDAILYESTLHKALNYMESNEGKEFDICGIKLINENAEVARSCSRFPNAFSFIAHSFGIGKIFPGFDHLMSEWNHLETRVVDHVIGAFFLVRRNLFESIRGFDERFFLYLEDLDFSLRAFESGSKTIYFSGAEAFHAGGGTSRQIKAKRLFYSLCSKLIYSNHHFSKISSILVGISIIFVEPVSRSLLCLITLSWSGFKETWMAYAMLWRWIFLSKS